MPANTSMNILFSYSPFYSIIMFVAFWAESSLHSAITGEASKIVSFTNSSFIENTAGSAAVDIVEAVVLLIEGKRYALCTSGMHGNAWLLVGFISSCPIVCNK